jgi:hypothetical protein
VGFWWLFLKNRQLGKNWILLIIPIYAKVSTYKYDEKNCIKQPNNHFLEK